MEKTETTIARRSPVVRLLQFVDFRNKLSLYILREHIGPFIFAVIIITFILIIDFVPRLVDMVVGKDLPAGVILKVFFFQVGWMLALSIPMSVLVATLMAFGRLTSDFEVTAAKASGIHVMRLMYPILLAAGALTYGMIYFNNEVLPDLNHRARVLMQDVRRMRPTLQIHSGAFVTDIKGYIILIDKVDHETSDLTGVKILELGRNRKSPRTIVAKSGRLTFTNNGQDLIFDLKDGEIHEFDDKSSENYRRLAFNTQRILVSEVSSEFEESDDNFRTDREKSSARMMEDIMKWETAIEPYRQKINRLVSEKIDRVTADSLAPSPDSAAPDNIALNHLSTDLEAHSRIISRENEGIKTQQKLIDSYFVEVYKKYSIPTACIVFVLIGAPMGILAKRGSMGISIGLSLGLFILYWAFLMGGESLADRGIVTPFWSMWAANFLLGAIGLYLLYVVSFEKELLTVFKLTKDKVKVRADD